MAKMILLNMLMITVVAAQYYEDHRCVCQCPSPAEMINSSLSREPTVLVADVPPHECDCVGVVLPHLAPELKDLEYEYCLYCDCAYQVRNTTVIKVIIVVVIALVWVLSLLLVYLTFLSCLNPLLIGQRQGYNDVRNGSVEEGRNLMTSSEEEQERI